MNYTQRFSRLSSLFRPGGTISLDDSRVDIRFYTFNSLPLSVRDKQCLVFPQDEEISENLSFSYPVFVPRGKNKAANAILLMHGLNERSWLKYLTWAEYLCAATGKPVILFPIAFHMNRSPAAWTNPRDLKPVLDIRRVQNGNDRSLSFANVALSQRISERPVRFYNAGRQSLYDLSQLTLDVKAGKHPLFARDTQIDIFAYSIGAFLSEVTVMADPHGLFSDSKLFLFCGGGIFSSMQGESRSIMDKKAFESLYGYYVSDFNRDARQYADTDKIYESFDCMISADREQVKRNLFYEGMGNRLKGIALLNDKVMPYSGVVEALGGQCASERISVMDFPFDYSHENPFPTGGNPDSESVNACFTTVFSTAAHYLA